MSFFEEVSAALPSFDSASNFRGDRLLAVSPEDTLGYLEKLIPGQKDAIERLREAKRLGEVKPKRDATALAEIDADWNAQRDGFTLRFRMTVRLPNSDRETLGDLCADWCSGDSVSIVRLRDDKPIRMAIVERVAKETAVVKMYFGAAHTSWSDSDETLYQLGIRIIEAEVRDPTLRETLRDLPSHKLAGTKLTIHYEEFRAHARAIAKLGETSSHP
jgi:hypothetical protein